MVCYVTVVLDWVQCVDPGPEGTSYHGLMKFEQTQAAEILGPFFVENALSDIPVFGPRKANVGAITDDALQKGVPVDDTLVDEVASGVPLPDSFRVATTVAEKLTALRRHIWGIKLPNLAEQGNIQQVSDPMMLLKLQDDASEEPSRQSSRFLHDCLLNTTMETAGFQKVAQSVLDNVMLLRAKEKYLFDCRVNRAVVDDDPWLKGVWGWVEGAVLVLTFYSAALQTLTKPRR